MNKRCHDFYLTVNDRNKKIESGELNIGRAICPNSYVVYKNGQDKLIETFGRKMDIITLRTQHLQLMHKKGLLRRTDCSTMTLRQCKEHLDKLNSKHTIKRY